MKSFLSKIRNKKLNGNISLLVILILLWSSVIALLSINQIQRLMTYGNMTFNYFRAYYLAKAWTELWLTEVYNRRDGFNYKVESGSSIISWNLIWIYSWFNPYFELDIKWSFKYLTNDIRYSNKCDKDNKIILKSWDGIVIALFSDETKELSEILDDEKFIKSDFSRFSDLRMEDKLWDSELTFWLFGYDSILNGNMDSVIVEKWNDLNEFLSDKKILSKYTYLTIKNSWNDDISFCITGRKGDKIPYSKSLITVRANYGDMEVWLESIVNKSTPSWFLEWLWTNE